jgi:hypothetical protein
MSARDSAGEAAASDYIYGDDELVDRKMLRHLPDDDLEAADQAARRVLHQADQHPDVYAARKPRAEELSAAIKTIRASRDRTHS